MSNVAIFLADGFEEIEALTVVDLCRRAGIKTSMVSITDKLVTGAHGIEVTADCLMDEVDFSLLDMIVLPGGMPGTTNLGSCKQLTDSIIEFVNAGKKVSAICAAPSVLGKIGILNGKKACCYPGFESYLDGATFVDLPVVKDSELITSAGPSTAIDFALAIIEELVGYDAARDIADGILKSKWT